MIYPFIRHSSATRQPLTSKLRCRPLDFELRKAGQSDLDGKGVRFPRAGDAMLSFGSGWKWLG